MGPFRNSGAAPCPSSADCPLMSLYRTGWKTGGCLICPVQRGSNLILILFLINHLFQFDKKYLISLFYGLLPSLRQLGQIAIINTLLIGTAEDGKIIEAPYETLLLNIKKKM